MTLGKIYADEILHRIHLILKNSEKQLLLASKCLSERIVDGRLIYAIGTGAHSYMAVEELFYRAGGLANIYPLLDTHHCLSAGLENSLKIERDNDYGPQLIKEHNIGKEDVVIVYNTYGVNSLTISVAQSIRNVEGLIIAITSPSISKSIPLNHPSRHISGKNLCDISDITIDIFTPPGDAVLEFEKFPVKVSSISTILMSFTINWLIAETVNEILCKDRIPDVWKSNYLTDAEKHNDPIIEKYKNKIRFM